MSSRLNLLFQTAPRQFLEKTVLFTDELTSPEATALMRNRLVHHLDLQPITTRATARVLSSLHLYSDMPLTSYFVPPSGSTLFPKYDPPYRFVFFPEFTGCRLLLRSEGDWLRVDCEEHLAGSLPPAESEPDSPFMDSFAYWDYTHGNLVGHIRATAIIVKEEGEPWTVMMQQIVGTEGFEVVRSLFTRPLKYF
jgi:hypothetical protein